MQVGEIAVTNGAASNLQGSGASYTATITPAADGDVTVQVPADAARDAAGNGNEAGDLFTITADVTRPTVTVSSEATPPVNAAFEVTIIFSEDVTGLQVGEIAVTNGAASNLQGAGSSYTATITPVADGDVTVQVPADAAKDPAGNGNEAGDLFTITADVTRPTVTVSSGAAPPVNAAFEVTIIFSEDVTGLQVGDLSVANGAASNLQGAGSSYTATITPAADGDVTVQVPADAARDPAGNGNEAGDLFTITADVTRPTVTVGSEATPPVNATFEVTITFSEDVTGLEAGEITVTNGAASNLQGSGSSYTATIAPAADGDVTVQVPADAARDAAGNGNEAGDAFTINADVTPPTVTVGSPATPPVNAAFEVTHHLQRGRHRIRGRRDHGDQRRRLQPARVGIELHCDHRPGSRRRRDRAGPG